MKKQRFVILFSAALVISFGAAMVSCGGGGGSSSSLLYTGETSQATISQTNAVGILTDAYMGGDMGSGIFPGGVVQNQGDGGVGSPLPIRLPKILKEAAGQIDMGPFSGSSASGAVVNQTIPGTCPGNEGSATFNIQVNDESGVFSGTLTFNAFCNDQETISGSVTFSGIFDISGDSFDQMSMSFTGLTVVSGSESVTVAGNISMTAGFPTSSITIDILVLDSTIGEVFWVNDYNITVTDMFTYEVVQVTGTFYDPVEGYVEISTPFSLEFDIGVDWPRAGQILITGAGGTRALLRAQSDLSFFVDIDIDADPDYEFPALGPFLWDTA